MEHHKGNIILKPTIYYGTFVHSKSPELLDRLGDTAVGVDDQGKITFVRREVEDIEAVVEEFGWRGKDYEVIRANEHQFFFPGFIDTHIHAPQYPNSGIFGQTTLLEWLKLYTYPMESSLRNLSKARRVYGRCVRQTLSHGTTTAAYYATTDVAATKLLADLCLAAGQRAFIGRCSMDRLGPDDYMDASVEAAVAATVSTMEYINELDPGHDLLCPVLTPRFALSCSPALLRRLGELRRATNAPIQTHMSENEAECQAVREAFPDSASYAAVYDDHGLLTDKTILAHAIHLSEEERALVARRGAKVSHCPTSNSALASGAARVRWLLDGGVTVGLGTDVSGGYSVSVLEAVRQACLVSRHVAMVEGGRAALSGQEALWMATRGGARVVGLEDRVGAFEVGMEWDAQLVTLGWVPEGEDDASESGFGGTSVLPVDIFGWESWEERVMKWVFNGDDRNVSAVWVRGRKVHSRSVPRFVDV